MALRSPWEITRASNQLWALNVLWVSPAVLSPEGRQYSGSCIDLNMPVLLRCLSQCTHRGLPAAEVGGKARQAAVLRREYEGRERRIDLVEFIAIARSLDADPVKPFRDFAAGEPAPRSHRKPHKMGKAGFQPFWRLRIS
jgi:hypothetical protein